MSLVNGSDHGPDELHDESACLISLVDDEPNELTYVNEPQLSSLMK